MRSILLASSLITLAAVAQAQSPSANPCPTGPAAPATGAFYVLQGRIIGPDGKPFVARGINIMYGPGAPTLQQVRAVFPGVNFIRLAVYDYTTDLKPYVSPFAAAGIVVEIEDHQNFNADGSNAGNAGGGQGVVLGTGSTGSILQAELNWFQRNAAAFKNTPYVWFGSNNEPSEMPSASALSNWQKQTYQAIRSAGNNAPILMEMNCDPTNMCGAGYLASAYANMKGIVWDLHYYNWVSGYSPDQTVNEKAIQALAASAQKISSADGIVPVHIGEYGNSTTGEGIDPGGTQTVAAVINLGSQGAVISGMQQQLGSSAWAWGSGNPGDGLTTSGGRASSPYGEMVELYVGTSPVQPTVCEFQQQAQKVVDAVQAQVEHPPSSADTNPLSSQPAASVPVTTDYSAALNEAQEVASQAAASVAAQARAAMGQP